MKITDKTGVEHIDPIVERGDILRVVFMDGSVDYYIVSTHAEAGNFRALVDLESGRLWSTNTVPTDEHLSFYEERVFADHDVAVTLIPSDKAELVIGG